MVNKIKAYLTAGFFSLLFMTLAGQEHILKQKLSWQADKNVFRYEVEIQNLSSKSNSHYETTDNFIEVSLKAGLYQYRVIAYDFLDRKASVSSWRSFTVEKALQPVIDDMPNNVAVSEKDKLSFDFDVDVSSITEETEVLLVNTATNKVVKGEFEIKKESDGGGEKTNQVVFPKVEEGSWQMKITNPGGLSVTSEEISVVSKKEDAVELAVENPETKRYDQKIIEEVLKKKEPSKKEKEEVARAEELARAEEERLRAEEEKRIAEEKARAEEERLRAEELARAEEEKRIAEEKARAEEEKRIAEERVRAEEVARAEELARAEEERNLAKEQGLENWQKATDFEALDKIYQDALAKIEAINMAEEEKRREKELQKGLEDWEKQTDIAALEKIYQDALAIVEAAKEDEVIDVSEEVEGVVVADDSLLADDVIVLADAGDDSSLEEELAVSEENADSEEAEEDIQVTMDDVFPGRKKRDTSPSNVFVFLGNGFLINLYDGDLFAYNENPILVSEENQNCALDMQFSLTCVPFEKHRAKLGFEFSSSLFGLKTDNDYFSNTMIFAYEQLNFVYHNPIGMSSKAWLSLKTGMGYAVLLNIGDSSSASSGERSTLYGYFGMQTGFSVVLIPVRHFAIESGMDFTHLFIPDMPTGILKPYIRIGIRF